MRTIPARPRAGTLFRLRIAGVRETRIYAELPEAAHWKTSGDTVETLAAVPIDSTNGITLRLYCDILSNPHAIPTRLYRIPTDSGNYRLEKLAVAPRFSAPPDSALAARMRAESERAAEVSRLAHQTPQLWTQPFLAPRTTRVTSTFGSGRVFNGEVTSRHMGTDYAGAVGAPVRAANRGIVRIVAPFYLGGNVIYLDHGAGVVTAYLHLSKQLVVEGDTVSRGQLIGRVGATGRVTGPHLHLIARYGAISVDPASLIGKQ